MRAAFRLTVRTPSIPIDIDFPAVAVVITNTTASPVFLRIGAPDAPTATNADLFCPAGESISFPVSGYTFAASFGNTSAIQSSDIIASGLFQTCVITFLSAGEVIPTYGAASFLSLSISDLWSNMVGSGPAVFPIIDLGPWGGAIIFIAPTTASGQGILRVEFSTDGVTFVTAGQWAFWPSIPSTLNVQRVARYARVSTIASGIAGEPALAYAITARASLSEVAQLTYVPFTSSISKTVNVPSLGEQNWILCTTNTPAIDVSLDITSVGGGNAAEEIICETSAFPAGPWQTVSFREQNAAPLTGDLFRSYGNLNAFTRIRLLEIGNNGPLGGTIGFSIRPSPDLSGVLQSIYAALGDVGYSVNANQDIYHELDTSRISLSSIQTNASSTVTLLNNINTNITTMVTSLTTINTSIQVGNTLLGTINSNIGTINTAIGTINTNVTSLASALTRGTSPTFVNNVINSIGPGVFLQCGLVFVPGFYIPRVGPVSVVAGGGGATPVGVYTVEFAVGTAVAATTIFYSQVSYMSIATTMVQCPSSDYTSNRSPGYLIPASQQYIWVRTSMNIGGGAPFPTVIGTITQVS